MASTPAPHAIHRQTRVGMRVLALAAWLTPLPGQAQALLAATAGPAAAPTPRPGGWVPSNTLTLPLGRRTRFVIEQRSWTPPPLSDPALPVPRASLALEFQSPRSNQAARDLFRVKLSGDGVLNFRPRGGGLKVFYEARF